MPPKKKDPMSILFHPKKPQKPFPPPASNGPRPTPPQRPIPPQRPASPQKPPANGAAPRRRPPPPKPAALDERKPPEGPFKEYTLVTGPRSGWKYDVMKFESRKPVHLDEWQEPIKLNRKEPKRPPPPPTTQQAVGPMLGPDGKPVIGADGKVVMVDAEGKPIQNTSPAPGSFSSGAAKPEEKKPRKKFQKKTRQVFLVDEETRKVRKEERYPWVFEDASGEQTWVGQMAPVADATKYGFFMPSPNDSFLFVPAHRIYKFQKKRKTNVPTSLEEAEALMAKINKSRDPERWFLRNGKEPSEATRAMFKSEPSSSSSPSLVYDHSSTSLAPGGRRLKTVDNGTNSLFGDDDDDEEGGSARRRAKDYGGEGDADELDFEEEFADDEEKVDADEKEDEEAKELEERIKREYRKANKLEGVESEEEEEDDSQKLTKAGKAMKKLIRNLEKNNAYESDEEENPYASSVEEEEEEPVDIPTGVLQQQPTPPATVPQTPAPSETQPPAPKPAPTPSAPSAKSGSHATSTAAPGHGGHSLVAKRATSPTLPKIKTSGAVPASRATSPLATSPGGTSRPGSPAAQSPTGPQTASPAPTQNKSLKRKATDDTVGPSSPATASSGSAPPKPKKRKAITPAVVTDPNAILEDQMVIDWLKNTPSATTRDCIGYFTPYLTNEAKKQKFTALVKEVAQLKGGVLVLRNQYRGEGASSRSGTPAASGSGNA